jgi:hypothetical protein
VVAVIGDVLQDHPDAEQEKRDAAQREKVFLELTAKANKQLREKHKAIFQECWDAVYNITTEKMVSRGRGATKRTEPERLCQPFLALPRKSVCVSIIT